MKLKFKHLHEFGRKIRNNWKTKYKLVIKNESTHEDKLAFLLSPKNIFVVIVTSAFVLIVLTAALIAFTPLRVYVPGYTNPNEYRLYKKMAMRVDSLELLQKYNQQYLDNFYNVMNDIVVTETPTQAVPQQTSEKEERKNDIEKAKEELFKEEKTLLQRVTNREDKSVMPLTQRATFRSLSFYPPATGILSSSYNLSIQHYGIDICNVQGTPITSIADGKVVFSGFTPHDGNIIIIHHSGDVISIYKCNDKILKKTGDKVLCGEQIATMGRSGVENKEFHLHFELWYNGFAIDPLLYLSVN